MLTTIIGCFNPPKKCLAECVDTHNELFPENKIYRLFSVRMSPNIDQYHMLLVPKSKETSAKILILVTIFVIKTLIVAKLVLNGLSNLSMNL